MPLDKSKRIKPPKDQSFKGGISIEMNIGKPDKNGNHRRLYGRFRSGLDVATFYSENSHNKDARFVI